MSPVLVHSVFALQVKETNLSSENLLEFYSATKVVAERSRSRGLARPELKKHIL